MNAQKLTNLIFRSVSPGFVRWRNTCRPATSCDRRMFEIEKLQFFDTKLTVLSRNWLCYRQNVEKISKKTFLQRALLSTAANLLRYPIHGLHIGTSITWFVIWLKSKQLFWITLCWFSYLLESRAVEAATRLDVPVVSLYGVQFKLMSYIHHTHAARHVLFIRQNQQRGLLQRRVVQTIEHLQLGSEDLVWVVVVAVHDESKFLQ